MLQNVSPLLFFGVCLIAFHVSEVVLVLLIEPEELGWNSLLFSKPYVIAMCCGISEYFIGSWLYVPNIAVYPCVCIGLMLVVVGEALRKAAWLTARASFTHLIKVERRSKHKLVTTGIYRFSRHPGYLGWLIWAIGTQVVLANPFCTVAFALTAWNFFSRRIPYEEEHMYRLFGHEYDMYRRKVPTRIPFIP